MKKVDVEGHLLLPCPFCGSGEFSFRDSTMWTGMRSAVTTSRLYHWCEHTDEHPHLKSVLETKGKTREEVVKRWNTRVVDV